VIYVYYFRLTLRGKSSPTLYSLQDSEILVEIANFTAHIFSARVEGGHIRISLKIFGVRNLESL